MEKLKELLDWLLEEQSKLGWAVGECPDGYEKYPEDYITEGYYEAYEEVIAKIQYMLYKDKQERE